MIARPKQPVLHLTQQTILQMSIGVRLPHDVQPTHARAYVLRSIKTEQYFDPEM